MDKQEMKPYEDLMMGDIIEFHWLEPFDGEKILVAQVEDFRDDGKQLTVAVYDDLSVEFKENVPLFRVKWNDAKGRYEGKRV